MIPYAFLFYTILFSEIDKYSGIWQDWLCMQIENGAEIEPWMMCLAENPLKYDTTFNTRIENERKALGGYNFNNIYVLAAGFAWKMFKAGKVSAKEIYDTIDHYWEDMGTYVYMLAEEPSNTEIIQKLEKELAYPEQLFEKYIWKRIPQETWGLFIE